MRNSNYINCVYFANYIVAYKRIKNSSTGCPRYEMSVIPKEPAGSTRCIKIVVKKSYLNERQLCEEVLADFLKDVE